MGGELVGEITHSIPSDRLLYMLEILQAMGLNSVRVVRTLTTAVITQLLRHPITTGEHHIETQEIQKNELELVQTLGLNQLCLVHLRPFYPALDPALRFLNRLLGSTETELIQVDGDKQERVYTFTGTLWDHLDPPPFVDSPGQLSLDSDAEQQSMYESFSIRNIPKRRFAGDGSDGSQVRQHPSVVPESPSATLSDGFSSSGGGDDDDDPDSALHRLESISRAIDDVARTGANSSTYMLDEVKRVSGWTSKAY
jgi:hypothetical protein